MQLNVAHSPQSSTKLWMMRIRHSQARICGVYLASHSQAQICGCVVFAIVKQKAECDIQLDHAPRAMRPRWRRVVSGVGCASASAIGERASLATPAAHAASERARSPAYACISLGEPTARELKCAWVIPLGFPLAALAASKVAMGNHSNPARR